MPDTMYNILRPVKIEVFRTLQDQKSFTKRISAYFVKFRFHISSLNSEEKVSKLTGLYKTKNILQVVGYIEMVLCHMNLELKQSLLNIQ